MPRKHEAPFVEHGASAHGPTPARARKHVPAVRRSPSPHPPGVTSAAVHYAPRT
jgi:hypothetical protein